MFLSVLGLRLTMGRRYDLVAFDMDGVLFDHRSSWAWIHERYGLDNEESYSAFVRGDIDEPEFMRRDIRMWMDAAPGIGTNELVSIFRDMPLIGGIQETVAALRWNGIRSVIVSGGVDIAAGMISQEYGFDGFAANSLETDGDGRLTGEGIVNVDLCDKGVKLREYMEAFGASPERTVSIGNSFTDIKMFENSGLSIAFNPVDRFTEEAADHVVFSRNISDVLDLIILEDRE